MIQLIIGMLISGAMNGSIISDEFGEYAKHDKSKYTDWSSLQFLLQYVLNSAILGGGDYYRYDENNEVNAVSKAKGFSTYHVKDESGITLSASLWGTKLKSFTLNLDFYVYLKGETVKVYGYLRTPHIEIIGSMLQANDGEYYAYFGYETDADNPEGTMYIHRVKKNGGNNDSISNKKMSGSEFIDDIGQTVLMYMMGFEEGSSTIKDNLNSALNSDSSTSNTSLIYVEKVFTGSGFTYAVDADNNPSWTNINLDVAGFNVDKLSGNVGLNIYGNNSAHTLNKVTLSGDLYYTSSINFKIESGSFILDNNADNAADNSETSAWVDSWHNKLGNSEEGFTSFKNAVNNNFTQKAQDFAGTYTSSSVRIIIGSNGSITAQKRSGNNWINYFKYHDLPSVHGWFKYDENGCVTSWVSTNYDYYDSTFVISIEGRDNQPANAFADKTIKLTFVRQADGTWKEGNNVYTYTS